MLFYSNIFGASVFTAFNMNCTATAESSKPMIRVLNRSAIGLSHFAPCAAMRKIA